MRVVYLNHTSLISGAERYLLALLRERPRDFSPVVLCPPGPLATAVAELGVPVETLPAVEPSLRLHPIRTPRGVGAIAAVGRRVRGLCRRHRSDLLHANSVRAGLVASAAGRALPPVVLSVHDCLPEGRAGRTIRSVLHRRTALALANSSYTARNFGGPRTSVVHPPVELEPAPSAERVGALRRQLGIDPSSPVLAVVGQITPWKGQETAIRALASIRERLPGAVLLLAGEVKFEGRGRRYDNSGYRVHLLDLCERLGLGRAVHFLGERDDIGDVLAASDLLLAPSWEEPFGIAVGEAMLAGTPVIATAVGGPAELIEDGTSGRLLQPHDHELWGKAILELTADPTGRRRLAERARRAAAGLGAERFRREIQAAYRKLERTAGGGVRGSAVLLP